MRNVLFIAGCSAFFFMMGGLWTEYKFTKRMVGAAKLIRTLRALAKDDLWPKVIRETTEWLTENGFWF